jgi:cytochrome oxidase assembly protein ShyY1
VSLPQQVLGQKVRFEGFASAPSRGLSGGPALVAGDQWPRLLQYFDYEQIGSSLGEPIFPLLVQTQALDKDAMNPTVLTRRSEWLTANWQPAASGPAKHYSYAFQWFAMAVGLTIITLVVNARKEEKVSDE